MKNLSPQLPLTLLLCLITIASYAECVISSNTNLSTFNPDACNGVFRVTNGATLYVNAAIDWTNKGAITLIVENNARVEWTGNYIWNLGVGSGIILKTGGAFSTANPCNSNKMIRFGSIQVASCSGGNGVFSFAQINAAGGTPTVRPTLSEPYLCSSATISAYGNPWGLGSDITITYQWTGTGPGPFTFTSPNTPNTDIIGITVPGTYSFTLSLTAVHGSKVYPYASTQTITLYVPPVSQTVTPTSETTCRGSNNIIHLSSSQVGVNYYLYQDNILNAVQTIAGTGSPIEFVVPFMSSTIDYTIKGAYPGNPCITQIGAILTISPANEPRHLASHLDTADCLVNSTTFIDFIKEDRISVSINSKGQDLGEVKVVSYVDNGPFDVQACATTNTTFSTAVLARHFAIIPQHQPSNPVIVRVYIDQDELNSLIDFANNNASEWDDFTSNSISNIHLGKYSNYYYPNVINGTFDDNCVYGAESKIIPSRNTGNVISLFYDFANPNSSYLEFEVSEFSEFWFHGNSNGNTSPLPVELAKFDAKCDQNEINITWSTYSEVNNDFYIVERSTDLENWDLLGTVKGAGNSNTLLQYTISDSRPLSNLSYYRLTQVDFDGKRKTYPQTSVSCNVNDVEIGVYPNPASDFIIINFGSINSDATLDFIDMQGKSVRKEVIEAQAKSSSNEVKINRNGLASGIYLIRLQIQGNEPLIKKVIFK